MSDGGLFERLAASETYWERHDSFCELEETYNRDLRAQTDQSDDIRLIPPDQEDSGGDRSYHWLAEVFVDEELESQRDVTAEMVLALVPRHWEQWVLDETRDALESLSGYIEQVAESDDEIAELTLHRDRLAQELALATAASQGNESGDREQAAHWAVTGIPGQSGVYPDWVVLGGYAEAQETIGFRERRRLIPPSTQTSNWTVERRFPETPDDANPDVTHPVTTDELLRHVPDDMHAWVIERADEALAACKRSLAEQLAHADQVGFAEARRLVRIADELYQARRQPAGD